MGTNYYIRKTCEHCGRYDEIHIGKSSMGWRFLFRKSPFINTVAEAVYLTCSYPIYDEYDNRITAKDFWDMVQEKQKEKAHNGKFYLNVSNFDFCEEDFV